MTEDIFTNEDKKFMELALKIAEKGRGTTRPNPLVGAVITDGIKFISSGYHKMAGLPHAEIEAIKNAGKYFNGSMPAGLKMYVTLEPCSIYGKTPPCTDAIIKGEFSEIIISMLDPNPKVNGNGVLKLREAGIKVKSGLLEEKAKIQNEVFITHIIKRRPFICAKIASTIDGKTATSTGDSKWITSNRSRNLVQKLRFDYGCVLTGINTVLKDNPFLYPKKKLIGSVGSKGINSYFDSTILRNLITKKIIIENDDGKKEIINFSNFYRIILDSNLNIPLDSNIIRSTKQIKTIIFFAKKNKGNLKDKINMLADSGSILIDIESTEKGLLDLNEVLYHLYNDFEITSIMLECGPALLTSFLRQDLIDKYIFFMAPKIIGADSPYSIFSDLKINSIEDCKKISFKNVKKVGEDILIEGYDVYGDNNRARKNKKNFKN